MVGTIKLVQGSRVQERELLEAGGAGSQTCVARICNAVCLLQGKTNDHATCTYYAYTHTNTQHSASRRLVFWWLSHRALGTLYYKRVKVFSEEGVS